ncbi:unnamed protein product [Tilletia caries]|uniref:HTH APSES-type domain-containing protein n=1 Tax=Tilletia caries TaxID=13290 RepID=A0A177V9S4_9BASI|nr:hypothetical protein CF336_g1678 [Tilletia laevis]KAE8264063.1 hypothetical protein A4X03_0g1220 [Tilletia caries]KAE8203261.1 hypothetical protein CF335_g3096 [Tilletia laevis]CAD6890804.1 unnamed protein product [Tilletia caries]CAD6944286.1 unnamed protein product [Tilletia caries]
MAPHSSSMSAPAPAANNSAPDALPPAAAAAAVPAFAPDVSAGPPPYNPYHKHLQPPPPAPSHPAPSSSMMAGPGGAAQVAAAAAAAAAAASVSAAAMSTHYAPNPAASFQQSPPPHLQHAPGPSAAAAAAAAQPLPPPPPPPMAVQQPTIAPASVYLANYSGVPVFELTVRGIAVMRRRQDGFLNATQILKVAGVDKGKRTKILEKEIQQGEHDKVQGGYGKYQGTWIPLSRAQELSATHNVSHILKPLLLFDPATETSIPNAAPRRRPNPNAPHQSLGRAAANATAPAKAGENTSLQSMTGSASGMGASGAAWDSSLGGSDGVRGSAPTHQPRFLALRSPASSAPGADFLHLQEPTSSDPRPAPPLPLPLPLPASTSQQMLSARESNGEDVFGPLTATTAAASKMLPGSGSKRSSATSNLGHETQYDDDDGGGSGSGSGEPAAKRARGQDGSIPRSGGSDAGMLLGPSPVKDLNALHPSAGLLQAASHPRPGSAAAPFRSPAASAAMAAANVRASAWNAASSSSSSSFHHANGNLAGAPGSSASLRSVPRYADRPRLPRASDEGERRARELLIHLFVDDGTGAGHGLLRGWTALDGTLESSGGAMGMGMGIGPGGSTTGHQLQAAPVKTPAEIAAAARAPFVFGAAAVGAVRANAGPTPGSGAVLPPDVAQRKLDELLALLIRAVGLDGFEDAIASAGAGGSSSSAGAAAGAMMGAVRRGGAIDLDIVTDDHGHTVLHWAAALGRLELVSVLLARPPVGSAGLQAAPLATDGDVLTSSSEKGKQREQQQQPAYSHSHIHGIPVGGANPNAGNHAGETALQRTVLVVNAWEHGYFPHLLRLLAPALMTRDFRGRTVLHHVALVSGLRGRAAGARYYLECILEFAREVYGGLEGRRTGGAEEGGQGEGGSGPIGLGLGLGLGLGVGGASTPNQRRPVGAGLTPGTERATPAGTGAGASTSSSSALRLPTYVLENLVDAQDEDGETALGIVARLGNAGLVKLLLDAGARKDIPNLLGIRPSDWGLEMVGLGSINGAGVGAETSVDLNGGDAARVAVGNELAATRPHDIMAALGSRVKRTPMKSSDILESISHSLEDLNSTYTSELSEKNAALEAVQMLLKQQTRELANRRRDVSDAQGRADAREETVHRLNNLVGVLNSLKVGPEEEREVVEHWLSSSSTKKGTRRSGGGDGDVSMEDGGGSAALAPIPLLDELSSAPGLFTSARSQRVESVVRLEFVLPLLQRECETLEHAIGEIEGAQRVKDAQYRRLVSICSGVPERNVVEMLDELVLAIESDGADVDLDRLSGFLDKIQPRTQGSALTTTTTAGGVGAAGGGSSMEADVATLARSAVPVANGRG